MSQAAASFTSYEKSEFMKYLDALEIEDLEMITKDRKSTKKNADGPIIYGAKSPFGQAKVGHSIPKHLLGNNEHEFGLSSYHRGQHSELKKLLSNEIFREQLVQKVSNDMAHQVVQNTKPQRKSDNRTSELRQQKAQEWRANDKIKVQEQMLANQQMQSTFSQRSRSVLPPIRLNSNKKDSNAPPLFANSSPMVHQRRSSLLTTTLVSS